MNPLLSGDYENQILNTNSIITFNPINFRQYNRTQNNLYKPIEEPKPENIHEFNPDIVSEKIKINRKYFNSITGKRNMEIIPINIKQRNIKDNRFKPPPVIPKPVEESIKVSEPVVESIKVPEPVENRVQVSKPVKTDVKPIIIKKLDSVVRKRDRRILFDQRCKITDSIVIKKGQYLSFPFSNSSDQPMYIHSIDLHVSTSSTNIRGTLYYTDKNPFLRKYVVDKSKWKSVRHSIRFFSYNTAVLNKKGAVIHIELKEIMIKGGVQDYFFIFEIDDSSEGSVSFFSGPKISSCGNTLIYDKMWKNENRNTIHYAIYGRQWRKIEKEKINKIENDTSSYISTTWKIHVEESRYYYFMVKTPHSCNLEIDGREIIKSNRCKRGSKGSCKLDSGNSYILKLVYSKDDADNYFAWTNKYNRNWVDDLADTNVIHFTRM